MLTVGAVERVPSANPNISNGRATARTGFSTFLKNVAAMDSLALAPEQIALRAA